MNKIYLLLFTIIMSTCIVLSYLFIDKDVAQWAFTLYQKPLFMWAERLSHLGEATYPLVISALLWIFYKFKTKEFQKAYYAGLFFLINVATGVGVNIIKTIFAKARPLQLQWHDEFGFTWFKIDAMHNSFPSGHTTTAFTVATLLALYFPRYTILFYIYAIIMASARVLSYNHYVSDVFAGALFATLSTLYLYRRFEPKKVV